MAGTLWGDGSNSWCLQCESGRDCSCFMNDEAVRTLTEAKWIVLCWTGKQENWALRCPGFCLAAPFGILSRWEVPQREGCVLLNTPVE